MSIQAKTINVILKVLMVRKLLGVAFKHPPRSKGDIVPKSIKDKFDVSRIVVNGKQAVTVTSKQNASQKHILFLHGGGYIMEAVSFHWKMIQRIIETTGFTVTLLDYPLAPEHDYRQTHEMVQKTFQQLSQKYPNDQFYLMGDSAGGGLAVALLQWLKAQGVEKFPQKTVLFSPWVDASLTNPKIAEVEKRDVLLTPGGLRQAAMMYAKGADLKLPALSPLYADVGNLGTVALFVGSDEIFLPDCQALKEKMERANTKVQYFEYPGMQHDWVLFPIPEGKAALQQACEFLQN